MLDMEVFREHANLIRADHDKRDIPHDSIDEVIRLDEEWRKSTFETDQLRRLRNVAARGIADAKKDGDTKTVDKIMKEVSDIGDKIKQLASYSDECISKRDSLRMRIPNILHDDVPIGEDDQKNTLHSLHGEKEILILVLETTMI